MAKKKKKQAWEIVLKDRFLNSNKPDNPYVTALMYFAVFFLSGLLIFVCFFQLCAVCGTSMMNTLVDGDHVLLLETKDSYNRGNIVVITKGDTEKTNIIKRIIATGGDSIMFTLNADDTVNLLLKKEGENEFTLVDESKYIREPMLKSQFRNQSNQPWQDASKLEKINPGEFYFNQEIKVDENKFFVMGDNRNVSEDSRRDGVYDLTNIHRKAVLTIKKGSFLEFILKILYHESNNAN